MTTKHTPTPFRVTKGGFEIKEVSNEAKLVAICTEKEYAAFIVRACNAHDELVSILDQLSAAIINDGNYYAENPIRLYVTKARAALAKAKGE